ncbi:hypothetical protein BDW72DRAFT_205032 [Aspergillus terricola var. indicus]
MAQACEKCRVLKVRCVRIEPGKPCAKCAKANSQCIVPEPKPRTRPGHRKPQAQDRTGGWLDQGVPEELNLDFVQTIDSNTACSSAMTLATPASADSSWITDLGLSLTALEHLLDGFRSLVRYFPFVVIPAGWTVAYMAADRPFLLLSAVACASSRFSGLQQALAEELKETLSHRVVIAGERDLDLLQGLLVHLAWFHFYLDPRSRQTYQYLQMAISMVVELDIERKTTDLIEGRTAPGGLRSREACRAYLGCYYLSSLIATATSKPDNFHYSEHVLRCTRMLQHEQEFSTDEIIYPLIKLQQLTQETSDAQVRLRVPLNGYHAAKIRIFETGLVYRYGQRKRPPTNLPGNSMTSANSKVTLNLTKSVICAKELFDTFMAIPEEEHDKLPLSIWYQLILAILVLYRLSIGLPEIPDWGSEIAQDTVNLPECLDMLAYRLRSAESKRRAESQPSNDKCLFTMFPDMFRRQQLRSFYSKVSVPWNAQSTEAGW